MKYIVKRGKYGYEIHTAKPSDSHSLEWHEAVEVLIQHNMREKA
jgi:hypothetical protein